MNSNMVLLGGHNIDFTGNKKDVIETVGSRLSKFQFENLRFFINYEQEYYRGREYLKSGHKNDRWQYSDLSLAAIFGRNNNRKVFAIIGPYGLMLRISNTYIEFITPISIPDRNGTPSIIVRTVTQWRIYFRQITSLLGGSEALYITQAYFTKYHDFFRDLSLSFAEKKETIKKRHGVSKKLFTGYGPRQLPPLFSRHLPRHTISNKK